MGKLDSRYPMEYLSYIVKDDKKPSYTVPEDIIEKAFKYQPEKRREIKSKTAFKIIENTPDFKALIDNDTVTPSKVYDLVIDYYLTNNKLIHESILVATCRTLLIRNNDKFAKEYKDKIKYLL